MYCRNAVALSINIKKHFARVTMKGGNRIQSIQLLPLPHAMPAHMNTVKKVTYLNCPEDEEVSVINHHSGITNTLHLTDYGIEREPLETGVSFSPRGVENAPFSPSIIERRETRPLKKRVVTELDTQEPVMLMPRATRAKSQYANLHDNMRAFNSLSNDVSKPIAKKPSKRLNASIHRVNSTSSKKSDDSAQHKRSTGRPRKNQASDKDNARAESSPFPRSLAFTFDFGDDNHDYFTLISDMEVASDQDQITVESIEGFQVKNQNYEVNDMLAPNKLEDMNFPVDWQSRQFSTPTNQLQVTTPSEPNKYTGSSFVHPSSCIESARPTIRSVFRKDSSSFELTKDYRKGSQFNDTFSLTPEPLEHFDSFLASLQLHLGFDDEACSAQDLRKHDNVHYDSRPVPVLQLPIANFNS